MVTLRDVAKRAGVSTAVVSAAISGGTNNIRMSEATRQRVEQAIAETGYRVNHAARSLRTARTGVISAVVPKIANPVFEHVIHGIQAAVGKKDGVLMLTDADWLGPGSDLLSRLVGGGMTDGFLVRRAQLGDDTIDEVVSRGIPCVMLNGPDGVHPSVWVDDRAGIRTATSHLLDLGHRRIAMVGGLKFRNPAHDSRSEGFREAYRNRGLEPPAGAIHPVGYDSAAARDSVRELLSGEDRPTAVIIDNVISAVGVYAAVAGAGLRIPDDVSVVAYHDIAQADFLTPPLTTVRMPLHDVGVEAARMLYSMIDGAPGDSEILAGLAELRVRGSTRPVSSVVRR